MTPLIPLRKEPWPKGRNAVRPCPVCGDPWIPWADSMLPCHAACLFGPEDRRAMMEDPRTDREISADLGLSMSAVRGLRARGRKEARQCTSAPKK